MRAIVIIAVLTISWLPGVVTGFVLHIQGTTLNLICRMFFYMNSLTDPILYALSSHVMLGVLGVRRVERSTASQPVEP